jgi:hypothetical protein
MILNDKGSAITIIEVVRVKCDPVCLSYSIRMQFGRCSVRTFYPLALEVLRNHLDIFSSFVEHKVGIDEAAEVRLFQFSS